MPNEAWHTLMCDLFHFRGRIYFIVVDLLFRFTIVRRLLGQTTTYMEMALSAICSEHGLPMVLISDRGLNFTSAVFTTCLSSLSICHRLNSAYHQQSNPSEWHIQTVKGFMTKTKAWRISLLEYKLLPI